MDGRVICIMADSYWSLKKFLVGRERHIYSLHKGKKEAYVVIVSVYPIKLETYSGVTERVPIK